MISLLCWVQTAPGHGAGSESSRLKPLPQKAERALVFTRTEGYRHDSIPAAAAAVRELGAQLGWQVEHGEQAGAFTPQNLARYRVVVFANTTGDVLDDAQQDALRAFVEGGGGFVGIHSAADTEYEWPWYGELVGAWFKSHPPGLQTADVVFEGERPLLKRRWRATDELYNYRRNPRDEVRVVATVDEQGYEGGTMGADHPIAWCRRMGAGRAWYTGLGHRVEMYADATFRAHLLRGLRFAAGVSGTC
ncbi:ThuA domain-containing protein [Luteimonas sp. SX5]|uniref:ThuA domain-containing protein n=1 Tax=Luteimonas galliterrae TaxID=2940486 RepID=A0ABT0MHE4_9GAMM|nr:ThuA domain-containing protein [Luteimonas galliterrae]